MLLRTERSLHHRRRALMLAAGSGLFFTNPGLFAEELSVTASMAEGPFYPPKMPLDTDNDLLVLNDAITPAVGEITHLSGKVIGRGGKPICGAFVEIWQVDARGAYLHPNTSNAEKRDSNFQGYGRCLTDSTGRYYFRTIKPVAYPGRTPHIHIAVSLRGKRVLTTQLLINGHAGNEADGLYKRLRDPSERASVLADFVPVAGSPISELAASFDIVLGQTVNENERTRDQLRGVAPAKRS